MPVGGGATGTGLYRAIQGGGLEGSLRVGRVFMVSQNLCLERFYYGGGKFMPRQRIYNQVEFRVQRARGISRGQRGNLMVLHGLMSSQVTRVRKNYKKGRMGYVLCQMMMHGWHYIHSLINRFAGTKLDPKKIK